MMIKHMVPTIVTFFTYGLLISFPRPNYQIAPEKVALFLGCAARGTCIEKTAYAYDKTISLFLRCNDGGEGREWPGSWRLNNFAEKLFCRALAKSSPVAVPILTRNDYQESTEGYVGGDELVHKPLSFCLITATGDELFIQADNSMFSPEEPLVQTIGLAEDALNLKLEQFENLSKFFIEPCGTRALCSLADSAQKQLAKAQNVDALCLSFDPNEWRRATDFRPFSKPSSLASYPRLSDEFYKGFKIGAAVGSISGFVSLLASIYSIIQHPSQQAAIAAAPTAFCSLLRLCDDAQKPYHNFFTKSADISCKWHVGRERPLSQDIFDKALDHQRSTKITRSEFHRLYNLLREKADRDEPYEKIEETCDRLLSHEPIDFHGIEFIPVRMTRRLHNERYDEALKSIRQTRAMEGFIVGSAVSLLWLLGLLT